MTFTKTLMVSLGVSVALSSVVSASSIQEEQEVKTRKFKSSAEQRKKASELIKKYKGQPKPPRETGDPLFSSLIYTNPQGQRIRANN